MRFDCFQLVGECDARGTPKHVVRKDEGHRHSLHNCEERCVRDLLSLAPYPRKAMKFA